MGQDGEATLCEALPMPSLFIPYKNPKRGVPLPRFTDRDTEALSGAKHFPCGISSNTHSRN